jgi:hypothetical protein
MSDGLDDAGGLSLSSMVKEIQGFKDKFKREDAHCRTSPWHETDLILFFQLHPSLIWKRRQFYKSVVYFQMPKL